MYYQVKDLQEVTRRINIIVKLVSRTPPRKTRSHTLTTFVGGDPTGRIQIPFWDGAEGWLQVGDYVEIENAYVSEFRGKLQLNVGKFGTFRRIDPPEAFEVDMASPLLTKPSESQMPAYVPVEDLEWQTEDLLLRVAVKEKLKERTIQTKANEPTHRIATFLVGDPTGYIFLELWDAAISQIQVGTTVVIRKGYVQRVRGKRILAVADTGSITPCEEAVQVNLNYNLSEI